MSVTFCGFPIVQVDEVFEARWCLELLRFCVKEDYRHSPFYTCEETWLCERQ